MTEQRQTTAYETLCDQWFAGATHDIDKRFKYYRERESDDGCDDWEREPIPIDILDEFVHMRMR